MIGSTRQQGVVTLAIGMILLLLITLATLYGARVGVMEQRISANEYRAKLVQAAAEAGVNQGVEFINSNIALFNVDGPVVLDDGSETDGWLTAGNVRWSSSVDINCEDGVDPPPSAEALVCKSGLEGEIFFYHPSDPSGFNPTSDDDLNNFEALTYADYPDAGVNTGKAAGENQVGYEVDYVVCPLNIPDPSASPPLQDPPCTDDLDGSRYYAFLVRSRGYLMDEDGTPYDANGDGVADIQREHRQVVTLFDVLGAGPNVPLMVAGSFGGTGTFDIVANPNAGPPTAGGGRTGMPLSVWTAADYNMSGSTYSCQVYEFFTTGAEDTFTVGNATYETCHACKGCPTGYYLSTGPSEEGIDILDQDKGVTECAAGTSPQGGTCFPNDLFEYVFGVPSSDRDLIKEIAESNDQVYEDCSKLNDADPYEPSGLVWIENPGSECSIAGGSDAGMPIDSAGSKHTASPHNPIILIAEGDIRVRAGSMFFGVIYSFGQLTLTGGAQIYGAVLSGSLDADSGSGSGNNVIVYDQAVLNRAISHPDVQTVARLPGSWMDVATTQ